MHEAIQREKAAGYLVRDVSAENRGDDFESQDPATDALRLIEVKGRDVRGETIVLTRNEYLCALNNRAGYVLAIVQIEGDSVRGYHAIPDPLGEDNRGGIALRLGGDHVRDRRPGQRSPAVARRRALCSFRRMQEPGVFIVVFRLTRLILPPARQGVGSTAVVWCDLFRP